MKYKLLNKKPFTVSANSRKFGTIRIGLSLNSGVKIGDKFYQVKLENGIIQLIPEKMFNIFKKYFVEIL